MIACAHDNDPDNSTDYDPEITFRPADAFHAEALAPLIYDSSHELLGFMFGERAAAEEALTAKLLRRPNGQFGHSFATMMLADGELVGAELGYDAEQLAAQELPGVLHMFRAMPVRRWPHLIGPVNRALSGYVPPPAADAYYINNIAVDTSRRGLGLGRRFSWITSSSHCSGAVAIAASSWTSRTSTKAASASTNATASARCRHRAQVRRSTNTVCRG